MNRNSETCETPSNIPKYAQWESIPEGDKIDKGKKEFEEIKAKNLQKCNDVQGPSKNILLLHAPRNPAFVLLLKVRGL